MERALPTLIILIQVLAFPSARAATCNSQDKSTLLLIQASFKSGPSGWDSNTTTNTECCTWSGVTCSSSGRINSLVLPEVQVEVGTQIEIPRSMCRLDALETLVLNTSEVFTGVIPRCIGTSLKQLRHLDLSFQILVGRIPAELGLLTRLEYLNLAENNLGGGIPQELCNLKSLTYFSLERLFRKPKSSHPQGGIPDCMTGLSKLKVLNLRFNFFSGAIPETIGDLVGLEELYLFGNGFTGSIPASIGSLKRLRIFDLNSPGLTSLPSSLTKLAALEDLNFWDMHFTKGVLPDFSNFKNIKSFRISNCSLPGTLPGKFPKGKLEKLENLFLERNAITGNIPSTLADGIPNVGTVFLSENRISGGIPPTLRSLKNMTLLDVSFNNLSGSIPESLGDMNSDLTLALGNNQLTGKFPVSLCKLRHVDLSNNKLTSLDSGAKNTATNNLVSLEAGSNEITGTIPIWLTKQKRLSGLYLSHNHLIGGIPVALAKIITLEGLDLSDNHLSGRIPSGFSRFSNDTFENNPGLCGAPLPPCRKKV